MNQQHLCVNRQVEQKPGGRGRGREWATLGVHPLSWLLSNNRLEKVPFVSVPHTSSNRLLLSNQDKGCTPSVAHSLALPLGPALLNLWNISQPGAAPFWVSLSSCKFSHAHVNDGPSSVVPRLKGRRPETSRAAASVTFARVHQDGLL